MESCLYEGVVHHERLTPVSHRFHYRLYMAYLDLAELPSLVRSGIVSASRLRRRLSCVATISAIQGTPWISAFAS